MAPLWFSKTVYENHIYNDYYCATEDFCSEKCVVQIRKETLFNFLFFQGKESSYYQKQISLLVIQSIDAGNNEMMS